MKKRKIGSYSSLHSTVSNVLSITCPQKRYWPVNNPSQNIVALVTSFFQLMQGVFTMMSYHDILKLNRIKFFHHFEFQWKKKGERGKKVTREMKEALFQQFCVVQRIKGGKRDEVKEIYSKDSVDGFFMRVYEIILKELIIVMLTENRKFVFTEPGFEGYQNVDDEDIIRERNLIIDEIISVVESKVSFSKHSNYENNVSESRDYFRGIFGRIRKNFKVTGKQKVDPMFYFYSSKENILARLIAIKILLNDSSFFDIDEYFGLLEKGLRYNSKDRFLLKLKSFFLFRKEIQAKKIVIPKGPEVAFKYFVTAAENQLYGDRDVSLLYFNAANSLKHLQQKINQNALFLERVKIYSRLGVTEKSVDEIVKGYIEKSIESQSCSVKEFEKLENPPVLRWLPVSDFVKKFYSDDLHETLDDFDGGKRNTIKRKRCYFCKNSRGSLVQIRSVSFCDVKCFDQWYSAFKKKKKGKTKN